mgnify:CR=1 FL=1
MTGLPITTNVLPKMNLHFGSVLLMISSMFNVDLVFESRSLNGDSNDLECDVFPARCMITSGFLLIMNFSKLLNQKASHVPSGQHALNDEYYKRISAIKFTMAHDDGRKLKDTLEADIVLLGVSRTSKTPTSIYLANRGFKTVNVPFKGEVQNTINNILGGN